jgi:hypothetical protein
MDPLTAWKARAVKDLEFKYMWERLVSAHLIEYEDWQEIKDMVRNDTKNTGMILFTFPKLNTCAVLCTVEL